MKQKIIYICSLFLTISLSCMKEDTQIPEKPDAPLLSKVNMADQPYYEFLYNYQNLVSEEKSRFNYTTYNYNDKNQLVSTDYYSDDALLSNDQKLLENALNPKGLITIANASRGSTQEYVYNNYGQLIKIAVSRSKDSNSEYSDLSYNDNDRIGRQTFFWDNKISGYIDYLYDESGNLIKETLYSISSTGLAEKSTTTQYEFDNNNNPFKSFNRFMNPGINTNPNNIIKETLTIHLDPGKGTDVVQETLTTYTYNNKGYPIRKNGTIDYLYK